MSYITYKLIHFTGIFALLTVLAAMSTSALRMGAGPRPRAGVLALVHGVAALMVLFGGFGMLARLGVLHDALPPWVGLKLALWVVLVAGLALVHRVPRTARVVLVALPLLAAFGGAIALYKPG